MERGDIETLKSVLKSFVPELVLQALQSDKRELSGLHGELLNRITALDEKVNHITYNSNNNVVSINEIKEHLKTLNSKVATQESRWVDQLILNAKSDGNMRTLQDNDSDRARHEDEDASKWKDRIVTGGIALAIAVLAAVGILNLPK